MPLFEISGDSFAPIEQNNFSTEKDLQRLIEGNLGKVFNCSLIATEFSTGSLHGGRIDTLAISEENNPVIIEYKKVESSELINQSLYYLSWIKDHKGDYQIAAQKALGQSCKIDWSDIRVICLAPNYRKYDLYAVQVMGANIELWSYRLFNNSTLYLEEVFRKSYQPIQVGGQDSKAKVVSLGKEKTSEYSFEKHLVNKSRVIQELAHTAQEFILGLDPSIEESPKKFYIAYRTSQNIVCMEIQKQKIILFIKLDPKQLQQLPEKSRDVTSIGHFGTGDLEITISTVEDLEVAKSYIESAYKKVGG